jgi:hypothetical protein
MLALERSGSADGRGVLEKLQSDMDQLQRICRDNLRAPS